MEVVLPSGDVCFIDEEDYYLFKKYSWILHISNGKKRYIISQNIQNSKNKKNKLHRIILGINDPMVIVDHINGNGLDNRKSNLRICTCSQNKCNSGKQIINTSGYKGVFKVKRLNGYKFVARIRKNYIPYHLGTFDNKIEAAKAYNNGAMKYHGEFAKLNKI
jgi:hypothetical protein